MFCTFTTIHLLLPHHASVNTMDFCTLALYLDTLLNTAIGFLQILWDCPCRQSRCLQGEVISSLPDLDVFPFSSTAPDILYNSGHSSENRHSCFVKMDTIPVSPVLVWWQHLYPWGSAGTSQSKALNRGGCQEPAETRLKQGAGSGPG